MKKLITILILALFVTGFASAQLRTDGTMYVSVNNTVLKTGTGWFAGTVRGSELRYGNTVTVMQISGKFAQVRINDNPSITGWIPSASLTARPLVAGTGSDVTVRQTAMAGKGFTKEIEDAYKQQNNLQTVFSNLDDIEKITVNFEQLEGWLIEGHLSMGEN